jgi:hypothetical protein
VYLLWCTIQIDYNQLLAASARSCACVCTCCTCCACYTCIVKSLLFQFLRWAGSRQTPKPSRPLGTRYRATVYLHAISFKGTVGTRFFTSGFFTTRDQIRTGTTVTIWKAFVFGWRYDKMFCSHYHIFPLINAVRPNTGKTFSSFYTSLLLLRNRPWKFNR